MRRTTTALPAARSRGPTSTRTGIARSSASTARRPNGVSVAVVELDPYAGVAQRVAQLGRRLAHAVAVLDHHDVRLDRRQPRRHPQAVVVAVAP